MKIHRAVLDCYMDDDVAKSVAVLLELSVA